MPHLRFFSFITNNSFDEINRLHIVAKLRIIFNDFFNKYKRSRK
ncbi:hypothetical protein HMPREF9163_00730 [Selenomonas sp. oral taxon 138 str. F0429]|nr:hypothetical protein HMPREF9163_00730 [Selenomonas sp. oral taxon 138 str. F0429]